MKNKEFSWDIVFFVIWLFLTGGCYFGAKIVLERYDKPNIAEFKKMPIIVKSVYIGPQARLTEYCLSGDADLSKISEGKFREEIVKAERIYVFVEKRGEFGYFVRINPDIPYRQIKIYRDLFINPPAGYYQDGYNLKGDSLFLKWKPMEYMKMSNNIRFIGFMLLLIGITRIITFIVNKVKSKPEKIPINS